MKRHWLTKDGVRTADYIDQADELTREQFIEMASRRAWGYDTFDGFELEVEDVTQEYADREASEQAKENAAARIKALPDQAPVTPAVLDDIRIVLGLK